jgi:hypothetical protein
MVVPFTTTEAKGKTFFLVSVNLPLREKRVAQKIK